MEELIKTVDSNSEQPAAAEILPAVLPSPVTPPANFTKVDNNLTGIGFFTASSKRSRKEIEKTTVVIDHGVEHRISILPSAKYGLPITQDQDFWLALMQLVEDCRRQQGEIKNPFTFTTAELTKILGQAHSGKNYKAVQEWLSVMKHTGIEGGVYNIAKKKWFTDRISAVDRVLSLGEQLPGGGTADKNHIWFSQWQLDNINSGSLMAIELTTYTQLQNNISKNLVPHLQEWLYASQRDGRFEKQYQDVCQLLGIRVYQYRSDVERQLQPSLDELTTHGYLSKWSIDLMADRKSFKVVLWHGPKYHGDRQARLDKNPNRKISSASETTNGEPTKRRPRQQRLHLTASIPVESEQQAPAIIINYQDIAELTKRGVGESKAREIIGALPKDCPLLDILEWGDLQVNQARGTRKEKYNPAGFYIHLLEQRVTPPATFESSRILKARQEAEFEKSEAIQKEREAALAAEEAEIASLQAQLEALPEADRLALYAEVKATAAPQMAYWLTTADPEVNSFFQMGARKKLKEGWKPAGPAIPPQAETTTSPEPENLHYAINPSVSQEPALEELPSRDYLNLAAILSTPQLPAPAPETVVEPERHELATDLL